MGGGLAVSPDDDFTLGRVFRSFLRLAAGIGVLVAGMLYIGRELERIDHTGDQVKDLVERVDQLKPLASTVQMIADNQRTLAQVDNDLRRQIDDLRLEIRRIEDTSKNSSRGH